MESVQGVRRGDIIWQIGFGSGFKSEGPCCGPLQIPASQLSCQLLPLSSAHRCNSAVWHALRPIRNERHRAWQHIVGREDEALATLQRIAAETAAERAAKEAAGGERVKPTKADAEVHLTTAAIANGYTGDNKVVATGGRRTLRSGRVLA